MWRSCRWWLVLIWLVTSTGVTSKLIGQTFGGNPENGSAGYAGVPASPSPQPAASAQEKPASGQRKDSTAPGPGANASGSEGAKTSGSERSLDSFKAPAGAIFVIGKELRDAIGFYPEIFVLNKKDYETLMERIAQLERLLQPAKPQAPSVCEISGQIEGDRVHLRIRYKFVTTRARTTVALGGQGAWPVAATMDEGELPLLIAPGAPGGLPAEDGLVVRVEKPGSHVLTLDVEMLPENKGDERSVNLGLPRAAITTLEQLKVPVGVAAVRVNSEPLRALTQPGSPGPMSGGSSRRWIQTVAQDADHRGVSAVALGAAERLELTWRGSVAGASGSETMLAAEGRRWDVRVDETSVLTEVTLILQARRGRTNRWELQLPPQAQVEVKEPLETDERIQKIELTKPDGSSADARRPTLTIELKEASAEPLRVVLQVRQTWTEGRVPIGPYFVNGAFRQWGIIRVTEPPDLRLRYHPQGDVHRREISSEQQGENYIAEFAYWTGPAPVANARAPGHPGSERAAARSAAPLVIEAVKGTVETRVDHELRWTAPGANPAAPVNIPARGWRALSKIRVTPNRTSVDRVDIKIPPDYPYDKEVGATSNNAVIDEVVMDSANGVAQIKLQKQSRPFTINLPAFYPVAEGALQSSLELPQPLQTLDRGGQVTASLPAEGWEFTPQEISSQPLVPSAEEIQPGEHEHTWHFERAPSRIELAWRPFRPDLEVHSVMDVTLAEPKARVQQALQIRSAQSTPSAVHIQIPEGLAGSVQVVQGGKLKPETSEVTLAKSEDKTHTLVLEYSFPLALLQREQAVPAPAFPANHNPIEVPFVRVAEATRTENKVRVWTEPGVLPSVDQGSWEEAPMEIVTGKDALPSLVIRSGSMENPLQIRLMEIPGARPTSTLIARALIQVAVDDPGQIYRVRFLVTQLHTRRLEVALPLPISQLNLAVLVNGQRIQHQPFRDEYHFRLELEPSIYSKPVMLEFQYRIAAELLSEQSLWLTKLHPPALTSNVFVDRVRWQVTCPSTWVSLLPGVGQRWDTKWVWEDGLLAPRPALTTVDLDQWLMGDSPSAGFRQAETNEPWAESPGDLTPALVTGRASLTSLGIVHTWRPIWLMACSLILVMMCLGVFFTARTPGGRGLLWVIMAGLGLIGLAGAVLWPGIVPAVIYGCEPGAVVVLALLGVQWLVHQRYRRQVVFLPGFTRLKAGSSIIRTGAVARTREPTTVDAPAKPEEKPELRS